MTKKLKGQTRLQVQARPLGGKTQAGSVLQTFFFTTNHKPGWKIYKSKIISKESGIFFLGSNEDFIIISNRVHKKSLKK